MQGMKKRGLGAGKKKEKKDVKKEEEKREEEEKKRKRESSVGRAERAAKRRAVKVEG